MHPERYDGYVHAQRLGLDVAFLPLDSASIIWIPEEHAVAVNVGLPERLRHQALVHGIGHALTERTSAVRQARAGKLPWRAVEDAIDRTCARRLIDLGDLHTALAAHSDANAAAHMLGVGADLLGVRLRTLRHGDMRAIGAGNIDRLVWTRSDPAERIRCHCLAPAAPSARRSILSEAVVGMLNLIQFNRNVG